MKHTVALLAALVLVATPLVQADEDTTKVHATKFTTLEEAQRVATADRLVVLDFYTDW